MKKIVIFGATGKIGPYVVDYANKYFSNTQYEIIASGRRETEMFLKFGIKYFSVDISKKEDFEKLPKNNIYAVILLAAQLPTRADAYNPYLFIDTNITGVLNVLEYCKHNGVDKILFMQTAYDVSLSINENVILQPNAPSNFSYKGDHAMYVISKNTAIEMIKHYHEEYGLKSFIFRIPTIYCCTPYRYLYQDGVKKLRQIYQMIYKAKAGEVLEIWGNQNYKKDMVYVKDFSQMLCKAVEAKIESGFYNVGTGMPITLEEEVRTIVDVFSSKEKKSKIVYCPEKPSGGGLLMDIQNAKEELGYEPIYNCQRLFEDFKMEMDLDRFSDLIGN